MSGRQLSPSALALLVLVTSSGAFATAPAATLPAWLDNVDGGLALAWVRAQNAETVADLASNPKFLGIRDQVLGALNAPDRLPELTRLGDLYYNFWVDADHPRGLWRRTTLDQYRLAAPKWEAVLDLDALAAKEHENWFWQGVVCLGGGSSRCLMALSRGGADARVFREFDLDQRRFVDPISEQGFEVSEAKNNVAWVDHDTIIVGSDYGPGTLSSAGYPLQLRWWRRGTPLGSAPICFRARAGDLQVRAVTEHSPTVDRVLFVRDDRSFDAQTFLWRRDQPLAPIDAPIDAITSLHGAWLLIQPRRPWTVAGQTYPADSLLAARFDDFLAGRRELEPLFLPTTHRALQGFAWTSAHLLLNILDDVSGELEVLAPGKPWTRATLAGVPPFSTLTAWGTDPNRDDELFIRLEGFLDPPLLARATGADLRLDVLKRGPQLFDASGLEVHQDFALSKDGTRVPYFLIGSKNLLADGTHPTLLTGYGGFEISLTPSYNGAAGRAWLSQGGLLAVANIRGGGEFAGWHLAAIREHRDRAYEDFTAVARDLFARKVTSPAHLGALGMSNGGLLVGNMLVDHPELFGAIVCESPLLDMKMYSHRQAGALWISELGDPDDPAAWRYLQHFSPLENLRPDVRYPPVLLTTSTRDDRVGPVQARRMAAKLELFHDQTDFFENPEGGHLGCATNQERAFLRALVYTFLWRHLTAG